MSDRTTKELYYLFLKRDFCNTHTFHFIFILKAHIFQHQIKKKNLDCIIQFKVFKTENYFYFQKVDIGNFLCQKFLILAVPRTYDN